MSMARSGRAGRGGGSGMAKGSSSSAVVAAVRASAGCSSMSGDASLLLALPSPADPPCSPHAGCTGHRPEGGAPGSRRTCHCAPSRAAQHLTFTCALGPAAAPPIGTNTPAAAAAAGGRRCAPSLRWARRWPWSPSWRTCCARASAAACWRSSTSTLPTAGGRASAATHVLTARLLPGRGRCLPLLQRMLPAATAARRPLSRPARLPMRLQPQLHWHHLHRAGARGRHRLCFRARAAGACALEGPAL